MSDLFENSPYKLLGTCDEIHVCDCCGKKNLNRTVAMEKNDGAIVYFGTTCASRALTGRRSRKTGDLIWDRAVVISKCKAVLDAVLGAIKNGECPKKAAGHDFDISFGQYADTGNKMPLRIYYRSWSVPGVELPADAY